MQSEEFTKKRLPFFERLRGKMLLAFGAILVIVVVQAILTIETLTASQQTDGLVTAFVVMIRRASARPVEISVPPLKPFVQGFVGYRPAGGIARGAPGAKFPLPFGSS